MGQFFNPVTQRNEERLLWDGKMVLKESDVAPLVRFYRLVNRSEEVLAGVPFMKF